MNKMSHVAMFHTSFRSLSLRRYAINLFGEALTSTIFPCSLQLARAFDNEFLFPFGFIVYYIMM